MRSKNYLYRSPLGISEKIVRDISRRKSEPKWMLKLRLDALSQFKKISLPKWGANLKEIKWNDLYYYIQPLQKKARSWKNVSKEVKDIFEKMGIPQTERKYFAGVGGQYDSEIIYHRLKEKVRKEGVLFLSMEEGLQKYPSLVKKYFNTVVPLNDNKIAALNTAVWSGGSFVYIPKNVHLSLPLQVYFRINSEKMGQFERTLIVAEKGSEMEYIEGCSAPAYTTASLHAAVVEIVIKERARVRYTTVQNWYPSVYNLVTKRALVEEKGQMEWIDCNLGSRVTMKYPSCILSGKGATGSLLSLAVADRGQHQDAGAKMIHLAPQTRSMILSKSISQHGGRSSYRGKVKISSKAHFSRARVDCSALILDSESRSDTYPTNEMGNKSSVIEHEASVSQIAAEQLFYLESRGINQNSARSLIVKGFVEPVLKKIPLEYAAELTNLIELKMEKAIG